MADTTIKPISHAGTEPHAISDIVKAILADVGRIIRGEIALARTEAREKVKRVRGPVALLGGAAAAGLFAGACFLTACIAALALVMPVWLAALLLGILLALCAGAAFAMGRSKLGEVDLVPQQTVQTIREDIQWAKQRTE